jgi:hypothetical protein
VPLAPTDPRAPGRWGHFLLACTFLDLEQVLVVSGRLCHGAVARIFHELLSRDREDERATGQPQGVGSETYLNGTSQVPTPEDARKDGHIRGRSR